ncbi:unnamed protein product [Sphagnum jensenii]|uniref:Uncharacterized protein n=1 Tax=Sphagnum jensenii TaxID=128206 RepID=A0ABP1BIR5_9BRYO
MMLGDNKATPITTLVKKARGGGPLDAGEGCSGPSNERQPKGSGHSTGACKKFLFLKGPEQVLPRLAGGGGEPPSSPIPAMTTHL